MSMLSVALEAGKLANGHPAWALLRARNAPAAVALLGAHLGGETKRLPAPEFFELVEEDLALLRDYGFDLPRPAQAYCADWLTDGILIRRAAQGREETYELSDAAQVAIRFVNQLAEPRQTVTESRLETILDQVRRLAVATDPDASRRLAALRAERDALDEEITRVASGDFDVLPTERALEQARDILAQAEEIPADFTRVRAEMEAINRNLRTSLIEQAESRGSVLDDIFRGVDHLAESDAGRSFNGFYSLILDPSRSTSFEADVSGVLDRDFAGSLAPSQIRLLRRLLPSLQDASAEIHDVMTSFSRSLRRFVQSQELSENRHLNQLLQSAQTEGLDLAQHIPPYTRTSLELDLSSMAIRSPSAFSLHNPADLTTVADVTTRPAPEVDLTELMHLARASEIDFKELRGYVNNSLTTRGAATIAEILTDHPATQGVASVIGLLVLADQHAGRLDGHEPVTWDSTTGIPRHGTVPRRLFKEHLT